MRPLLSREMERGQAKVLGIPNNFSLFSTGQVWSWCVAHGGLAACRRGTAGYAPHRGMLCALSGMGPSSGSFAFDFLKVPIQGKHRS